MAIRLPRNERKRVPYKFLINLSTVHLDFDDRKVKRNYPSMTLGVFDAERLVTCRKFTEVVKYLVKWKGYSSFENTWEPPIHISPLLLRYFERPDPPKDLLYNHLDRLRIAIMEALRHIGPEQGMIIEFRHDVYKYLFAGKGKKSDTQKNWTMFDEDDFTKCDFPANWNCIVDYHGDGVKMKFPVKMRIFLGLSSKTYQKVQDEMKIGPRAYIQKLSMKFTKIPTSFC